LFKKIIKKEDTMHSSVQSYCMQDMSSHPPSRGEKGTFPFSSLLDSDKRIKQLLKEIEEREKHVKRFTDKSDRLEQEAYEKGFAQGERAGKELGEKRFESVVKSFTGALQELRRMQEAWHEHNEQHLIELVCAVARKVVQREVSIDRSIISRVINAALKYAADQGEIIIRIHPSDLEYASQQCSEVREGMGDGRQVRFEGDERVARGDAVIESKRGIIETGIEKCFQDIEHALRAQARDNIQVNSEAGKRNEECREKA
jgi:flagellar biosynthesis/type III secretory pathway protein FliH